MLCLRLSCIYPQPDAPANPLLHKSTGVLRLRKGHRLPCEHCFPTVVRVPAFRVEFIGVNCRFVLTTLEHMPDVGLAIGFYMFL